MTQLASLPPFDPALDPAWADDLLRHVADNLFDRLGEDAIALSCRAIARLRQAADPEGAQVWLAIHEQLVARAQVAATQPTLH
jgi:hypothetical protein